jgi:lipopolysaccharide biosynthesis glycosyltransferase
MISDRPSMVFQLEHMMRTVKRYSGDRKITFSVIINGNSMSPVTDAPKLTKRNFFHNSYIDTHAEVYDCPQHWTLHTPCRWFIEPKMDQCVFIDTDVITCSDLTPLYNLTPDTVHGVPALVNPLTEHQWNQIGMNKEDIKYYFNFGMIVVPSKHIKTIGTELVKAVPLITNMFENAKYHAGQISLSYILKKLNIKRNNLSKQFNWLDSYEAPSSFRDVLFMHYTLKRELVPTKKLSCLIKGDKYADVIAESANYFYNHKIFV